MSAAITSTMLAGTHSPAEPQYVPGDPGAHEMRASLDTLYDPGESELRLDTPFLDTALEWQSVARYNDSSAPLPLPPRERNRLLIRHMLRLAVVFVGCTCCVILFVWLMLPELDPEDREKFRIPRSITELHALNKALADYTQDHYAQLITAWITLYLYLQTFSIPGSMWMSVLAGALWGIRVALPIACLTIATGATLCYMLSLYAGECIHLVPQWEARVRRWQEALSAQRHNLISYLVLLRISPVPHFVINLVCPHLGVPIGTFWLSALFGSLPQTVIHTAVGEKLDDVVSSDSGSVFTWHNLLLFGLVAVAAAAPMLLRNAFHASSPEHTAAPPPPPRRERGPSLIDRALSLVYPRWRHAQPVMLGDDDASPINDQYRDEWE